MVLTSPPTRLVLAVVAVVVLLSGSAIAFDGFDGRPRPTGMNDQPDTTYGRKPVTMYKNKVADCTWYGWENKHYSPNNTGPCNEQLWAALSEAADLSAFTYFVPQGGEFFDPSYNEYLCTIGCFDLNGASSPASSPAQEPTASPPAVSEPPPAASPPPSSVGPPPASSTPPTSSPPTSVPTTPSTPGTPPPGIAPPPPATLFRPPPPPSALAPPVPSMAPGVPNSSNPVAPGPGALTASGSMLAPGYGSMLLIVASHFVIGLHLLFPKH